MDITPEAATAIQTILAGRPGGLRLSIVPPQGNGSRLDMRLTVRSRPEPDDEVLTGHGSQVFVEKRLYPALADKTLDVAEPDDDEHVGFKLVS